MSHPGVMVRCWAALQLPMILAWDFPAPRVLGGSQGLALLVVTFLLFPSLLRGEAPDPGSPGVWVGVPHPGGSQIFALEQAGAPGKAGPVLGGCCQSRIWGQAAPLCPLGWGFHVPAEETGLQKGHFLSSLQKLPEITLKRLKLQQSKARHLPLHLHAHRLSLPLGERIDLVCKPPLFFQKTLKRLELDIANN